MSRGLFCGSSLFLRCEPSTVFTHFTNWTRVMSQIAATAQIGENTILGAFCVLGESVTIGSDTVIGNHVIIHDGSIIGNGVRIDDHTVIGKRPMKAANSAVTSETDLSPATIGDRCLIGTGVVIYAGSSIEESVLVADLATVREDVQIGEQTIVGRGVAIENKCRIGRYCKLETNVYITAYSLIEDYVFLAPGVLTSNDNFMGRTEERFKHFKGVTVRRGGRLGVGSVILPGREIGSDSVVAGGSVVTKDTESRQIVAGTPARYFGDVLEEQLLERQNWFD